MESNLIADQFSNIVYKAVDQSNPKQIISQELENRKQQCEHLRGFEVLDATTGKIESDLFLPIGKDRAAFSNGKDIFIAERGTVPTNLRDQGNNLSILAIGVAPRINDARRFVEKIQERYPKSKIFLCGHSLGGHISQFVATLKKYHPALQFTTYSNEVSM